MDLRTCRLDELYDCPASFVPFKWPRKFRRTWLGRPRPFGVWCETCVDRTMPRWVEIRETQVPICSRCSPRHADYWWFCDCWECVEFRQVVLDREIPWYYGWLVEYRKQHQVQDYTNGYELGLTVSVGYQIRRFASGVTSYHGQIHERPFFFHGFRAAVMGSGLQLQIQGNTITVT